MREFVRALNESGAVVRPWRTIPARPPRKPCFLRFATRDRHPASLRRAGIFVAAHRVLRRVDVDRDLAARLRAHLDWFIANLVSPHLDENRAVFLFKSDAVECMRHVWELIHALREADVWIEMQIFERPGKVMYEDALQVAVIPWANARSM